MYVGLDAVSISTNVHGYFCSYSVSFTNYLLEAAAKHFLHFGSSNVFRSFFTGEGRVNDPSSREFCKCLHAVIRQVALPLHLSHGQ